MQLIEPNFQFQFPNYDDPMVGQNPGEDRRPFLQIFKEHFLIRQNQIFNPNVILKALIRDLLNNNMAQYFDDIGEAQLIFTAFSNSQVTKDFFMFIQPEITLESNVTACDSCNSPAALGSSRTSREALLQIDQYNPNDNQTLKLLIEGYFHAWKDAETNCNLCNGGKKTRTSRTLLASLPEAFAVSLGRERFDVQTNQMYEITDPIDLGGDVVLTDVNQNSGNFEFVSCVSHWGQAAGGHFVSFIKWNNSYHIINDANPIKQLNATSQVLVQKSNVFLYKKI